MPAFARVALLLSALMVVLSCAQRADQPVVEKVEGVIHVHNPQSPLQGIKDLTFVEELAIDEAGPDGQIMLYDAAGFTVDLGQNIYISDRADWSIKVFDCDGNFTREVGRKGEGPGEFRSIGNFAAFPDGSLLIMDYQGRRSNVFGSSGNYLDSRQWRNVPERIYLTSDDGFTAGETLLGEKQRLFLKHFDRSGTEVFSYGEFQPYPLENIVQGDSMYFIPSPFAPQSLFAGDQVQGWIYHCHSREYLIEVYDKNGSVVLRIDRPYVAVAVTEEDKRDFISRYEGVDPSMFEAIRNFKFPERKPVAAQLMVDDRGNLWIKTFETRDNAGRVDTAYDIFDRDGFYQFRVWSYLHPEIFFKGKMYLMDRDDDTGFRTVKRYRVIWN